VIVAGRISAAADGQGFVSRSRTAAGRSGLPETKRWASKYALLQELDLADFLGVEARYSGQRATTVEAKALTVLAKALRPPPEKWHGLSDVEIRYRQQSST
jgi:lysyl-tRNA synthetase class 2